MNDDVLHELSLLREFGYSHLDLSRPVPQTLAETGSSSVETLRSHPATHLAQDDENNATSAFGCSSLPALRGFIGDCTRCRLGSTRTNLVFGVGNPDADLMFVGEAPGRDEDLKGEPFVGRAGQLLTDIIKAMKLTRDDVYIANVIKCRPPENRNPEPDELETCRPFIQRQVELIRPKVIVVLGRFALQSLTEKSYSISAVRGQWLEYNGIRVMPTYHPAYLLRNPGAKKDVWSDMKKVMTELAIPL